MKSIPKSPLTVWQIDTINDPAILAAYTKLLSAEELARVENMRIESSKNGYIISHAVMRLILKEHLRLSDTVIDIQQQEKGKPYIKHNQAIHFNLSHTKNIALFGISTCEPIGIDIEYIKPDRDIISIAKRFFNTDEFKWLQQFETKTQIDSFYQLWCYKEACLKGTGSGLQGDLSSFAMCAEQIQTGGKIQIHDSHWYFRPISIQQGYKAAVAQKNSPFEIKLIHWKHAIY